MSPPAGPLPQDCPAFSVRPAMGNTGMRLQGKVALVTGAGGGFGEGIARLFAAEGAQVVCADLRSDAAGSIAQAIGAAAHPVTGDVSNGSDVQRMVDAAVQAFGGLDIVVNNAGTTHRNQPMLDVDEAEFDRVYAVNVKSIYWMARACVPVLRRQGRGGSIVHISSTAGIRPRPGLVWYNGTKGALNTITQCMATELAPGQHPRQRRLPGDRRHQPAGAVHGPARHTGEPRTLPGHHSLGPHEHAGGHRQRLPMAGRPGVVLHHRRAAAGGRRALRLTLGA